MPLPMRGNLDEGGFEIVPGALEEAEREELLAELGPIAVAGKRGVLASPIIRVLCRSERMLALVAPHLQGSPVAVRTIFFDKSPDSNWLVPWHQDLTIAVHARVDVPGFGPWSTKEGVTHVQPPLQLLEQMLTIRLHLDAADEANGALRVLPGSHRLGRLNAETIRSIRAEQSEVLCTAAAGDALVMRPLLLHASSRSRSAMHRRVLHIEYAGFDLPGGLRWHTEAS